MVRVFRCHRFVSQQVVPASSEPSVICSCGDRLFVACDNYLIEEFDMKHDYRKVRQFSAIGRISEMVYSESGEFLATLEEETSRSSSSVKSSTDFLFRVYSNLGAVSKCSPMKVRISGQMIRARARKTIDLIETKQLVVIETPLKRAPSCIAAYGQNIAIAVKRTVLLYACEKNKDGSQDIRCILELEFAFSVHKLEICEEFVMGSSGLECQIVQLNFYNPVKSVIDAAGNIPSRLSVQSFLEHRALRPGSPSNDPCLVNNCKNNPIEVSSNTSGECGKCADVSNSALKDATVQPQVLANTNVINGCSSTAVRGNHKSQDTGRTGLNSSIKRPLVRQTPVSDDASGPSPPPSPPPVRENKIKETLGGGLELLGPVPGEFHLCSVYVEFEGKERDGRGRNGVLQNGVTTLLYRKLEPYAHQIHSIQLLPVFIDEEVKSSAEATDSCLFLSSKRSRLVGLFSIVSTATYAYIYSLLSDCQLISSFPYAIKTLQVKLSETHLYAMSEMRLDVYTARCLSRIIFDAEKTGKEIQQTIPFVSEEPCLLGYHTFFDLRAMSQIGDHLTLLSKSTSLSQSPTDSWSIYVLRRPEVISLYNDMVDQCYEWEKAHAVTNGVLSESLCLMQEANMLLRGHLYLQRSTDRKKELISLLRKSCLYLAQFYERHDVKGYLAIPYYLMADHSLVDIVRIVQESKTKISPAFREALLWFGRKLTDQHISNDLINKIEGAEMVSGCTQKLRSIASSNAY